MDIKWALKMIAKLFLSRLPVSYKFWRSVGLFGHGCMDSVDYPIKIFKMYADRAYPQGFLSPFVILELGPGDSIASAIISYTFGVKHIYLVDVGRFANQDVSFYQSLAAGLKEKGLNAPNLSNATSFEEILCICNAEYLTDGISSLKTIPSCSVDFIWSHSVLEHVQKNELMPLLLELKRIARPGSYSSHNIDFQDHLDHALNNLRFSEKFWESSLVYQSGGYTNRIPAVVIHNMFKEAGFKIKKEGFDRWPTLPTPRCSMHMDFQNFHDDELINRTSHVLLKA